MKRIRIRDAASRDLDSIFRWIAEDNPVAAQRVKERIVAAIRGLAYFSTGRRGRVAGTLEKVVPGLPYIIHYAEGADDDGQETIVVLTVRHASREPLG